MPPPARAIEKTWPQWSRPPPALMRGVRPNSPIQSTSVSSSRPHWARSSSKAEKHSSIGGQAERRHLEARRRRVTGQKPRVGRRAQPAGVLPDRHDVRIADHLLGERDRRRQTPWAYARRLALLEPLHHRAEARPIGGRR